MYELKKIGKLLTRKSVGTGLSSYEKYLPGRDLIKVEKHWCMVLKHHFILHKEKRFLPTSNHD